MDRKSSYCRDDFRPDFFRDFFLVDFEAEERFDLLVLFFAEEATAFDATTPKSASSMAWGPAG